MPNALTSDSLRASHMRRAINRNLYQSGPSVHAKGPNGLWCRITDARERKGQVEARTLYGNWFTVQAWEVRP